MMIPKSLPSIIQADHSMWDEGIQGVGDICNSNHTFSTKKSSKIRYHSFIELFNFKPDEITSTFEVGLAKYAEAIAAHQNASLIPHAPYSVPPLLFELIKEHYYKNKAPWSIHNQESEAENEMFRDGNGALWECFKTMGVDLSWFHPTEKNSLASVIKYFPENTNLLLVHSTASSKSDIEFLRSANLLNRTWLSQCPNTNLFIEKKLPQIKMFYEAGCKITLGTDSLASNSKLSILEELKTIHVAFPEIPVEELLSWATTNGASYFKWTDFGSFIKNTTPGIILISHSDEHMIHADSRVKEFSDFFKSAIIISKTSIPMSFRGPCKLPIFQKYDNGVLQQNHK